METPHGVIMQRSGASYRDSSLCEDNTVFSDGTLVLEVRPLGGSGNGLSAAKKLVSEALSSKTSAGNKVLFSDVTLTSSLGFVTGGSFITSSWVSSVCFSLSFSFSFSSASLSASSRHFFKFALQSKKMWDFLYEMNHGQKSTWES